MATMCYIWSKAKISFQHPHAGIIKPGKNRMEDKLAQRIINEGGDIIAYKGQDKNKEIKEPFSSFKRKKKIKYGGDD